MKKKKKACFGNVNNHSAIIQIKQLIKFCFSVSYFEITILKLLSTNPYGNKQSYVEVRLLPGLPSGIEWSAQGWKAGALWGGAAMWTPAASLCQQRSSTNVLPGC